MLYQSEIKQAYYGCCNAAARTSSLLVAELVLPQASNCNTSSRGEGGGGSPRASTRKDITASVILVADFFRHL